MSDSRQPAQAIADDALVGRAQAGDLPAFNALVERYQRQVFGLCLRMLASREAAEDAAQDAFFSAWRGIKGYRGGSLQAWLLRIAGNRCRDELRRRRRRPTSSLDGIVEAAGEAVLGDPVAAGRPQRGPEQRALGNDTLRTIETGLQTLPADQREAVLLCDVHGLAYQEIAAAMGTSVGTVKSRVSRGRARLRDYLLASGELPSPDQRPDDREPISRPRPARSGL